MMSKTKVSIIMPTFNDSGFIDEAISSVVTQSFNDWELITVNDASTDNTREILTKWKRKDKRIKLINNQKNIGVSRSLNKAISVSKTNLIARIDSDDVWGNKDKLKIQIDYLDKHPDVGLVGSWASVINDKGNIERKITYPSKDESIRNRILYENCFIHSSVVFRKRIASKFSFYKTNLNQAEDYRLWLAIGTQSKLHNVPKTLIQYRLNNTSLSQTKYKDIVRDCYLHASAYANSYPDPWKKYIWKVRKFYPNWLKNDPFNKMKNKK